MRADVGALVPAAGAGRRMGGVQKPFLELRGRPVLLWALQPFLDHPAVIDIVVALPHELALTPPAWLVGLPGVRVVRGGETRTDSVGAALASLIDDVHRVVVHDGARPLVRREWIDACLAACGPGRGAVIGFPVSDTIKEVDASGRVASTPDRDRLWQVQTPQAFPRELLEAAYAAPNDPGTPTDDAGLVERCGGAVHVVRGDATNVKLTRPEDVVVAEAWLSKGDL